MLISPDRKCQVCGGITYNIEENGDFTCLTCNTRHVFTPLDSETTAKIMNARRSEAGGEEE